MTHPVATTEPDHMDNPSLIDSHCHLDFPDFDNDREKILQRCNTLNIIRLILPGISRPQWQQALNCSNRYSTLSAAIGLHPLFLDKHNKEDLSALDSLLATTPEIVAVGEIGLDYYPADIDRDRQQALFSEQLRIAAQHQRPLLLHVRKAHQDIIRLLRDNENHQGIVHAFSGSLEQALQYIEEGFLIGVGGVATRLNAHKLNRTIKEIPLESIALETDAPDLPPIWAKGERNSPEHLPGIAQAVADLRGESLKVVAEQTTKNVDRIFRLK